MPRRAGTAGSGEFEPAKFRRYRWEVMYSTAQYQRYGGRITKRYLAQLWTARHRKP